MARLTWHEPETRQYVYGVDRGVYFDASGYGVAWSGLVSVTESNETGKDDPRYLDGDKTGSSQGPADFKASLEVVGNPYSVGSIKDAVFSMTYRVLTPTGYQIHFIFGARAVGGDMEYTTLNDSTDLALIGFDITTKPQKISGVANSSHIIVDTSIADPEAIRALEDLIYGTEAFDPYLPSAEDLIDVFEETHILKVTNHGDGSGTIEGPDTAVFPNGHGGYTITWPSVEQLTETSYRISSL